MKRRFMFMLLVGTISILGFSSCCCMEELLGPYGHQHEHGGGPGGPGGHMHRYIVMPDKPSDVVVTTMPEQTE
jgi:hypothetical protein